jgi:hypothetical protein
MTEILDITFIADERRRVAVGDQLEMVYDGQANNGAHWRIDHLCEVINDPERGQVRKRVAPYLHPAHIVRSAEPLTIEPSIRCLNCGLHGFVRESKWEPA